MVDSWQQLITKAKALDEFTFGDFNTQRGFIFPVE